MTHILYFKYSEANFFHDNVGVCSGKHGFCAADHPGSASGTQIAM